jgi:hypothetical protein
MPIRLPITQALKGFVQRCDTARITPIIASEATRARAVAREKGSQGKPPIRRQKRKITNIRETAAEIEEARASPTCPNGIDSGIS